MTDESILLAVATLIATSGVAVLVFRVGREVAVEIDKGPTWIPWADRLVIAATLSALLFGVLPFVSGVVSTSAAIPLAMASSSSSVVLLLGYVFAILAHYRLILHGSRTGPRVNPEPPERWLTWVTAWAAFFTFVFVSAHAWGAMGASSAPSLMVEEKKPTTPDQAALTLDDVARSPGFVMADNLVGTVLKSSNQAEVGRQLTFVGLLSAAPRIVFDSGMTSPVQKVADSPNAITLLLVASGSGSVDVFVIDKNAGKFSRAAAGALAGVHALASVGMLK